MRLSLQQNILGGSAAGSGDKDGDNPRLILDALPSKYDFPGLATSLEKVFKQYSIKGIAGTDDEITQGAAESTTQTQPVEMPFSITVASSPQATKPMLQVFEKSIRPFKINKLTFTGQDNEVRVTAEGVTYYQPQKKFNVKTEIVR